MISFLLVFFSSVSFANINSNLNSASTQEKIFVCDTSVSHPMGNATSKVTGQDAIQVNYTDLTVDPASGASQLSNTLSVSVDQVPQYLASSEVQKWNTVVTGLNFSFSTENYGTIYTVELCYLGPVSKVQAKSNSNPGADGHQDDGIYNLDLNLNISDFLVNGQSYRTLAGLTGQLEILCDLRYRGLNQTSRTETELSTTQLEKDSWLTSDQFALSGNTINFSMPLNTRNAEVPRFCRIIVRLQESKSAEIRKSQMSLKDLDINVDITH